eukprot:m.39712 g.39712  ORF g.39712 m.39712 type:complete len:700 (+) comp32786_c0_seq3:505-2604(+)
MQLYYILLVFGLISFANSVQKNAETSLLLAVANGHEFRLLTPYNNVNKTLTLWKIIDLRDECPDGYCRWKQSMTSWFLFLVNSRDMLVIVDLHSMKKAVYRDICAEPDSVIRNQGKAYLLTCLGRPMGNEPPQILSFEIQLSEDHLSMTSLQCVIDSKYRSDINDEFSTERESSVAVLRYAKMQGRKVFLLLTDMGRRIAITSFGSNESYRRILEPHHFGCGDANASGRIQNVKRAVFPLHSAYVCICITGERRSLLIVRSKKEQIIEQQTHNDVYVDSVVISSTYPGMKSMEVHVAVTAFGEKKISFFFLNHNVTKLIGHARIPEGKQLLGKDGVFTIGTDVHFCVPLMDHGLIPCISMEELKKGNDGFAFIAVPGAGVMNGVVSLTESIIAVTDDVSVFIIGISSKSVLTTVELSHTEFNFAKPITISTIMIRQKRKEVGQVSTTTKEFSSMTMTTTSSATASSSVDTNTPPTVLFEDDVSATAKESSSTMATTSSATSSSVDINTSPAVLPKNNMINVKIIDFAPNSISERETAVTIAVGAALSSLFNHPSTLTELTATWLLDRGILGSQNSKCTSAPETDQTLQKIVLTTACNATLDSKEFIRARGKGAWKRHVWGFLYTVSGIDHSRIGVSFECPSLWKLKGDIRHCAIISEKPTAKPSCKHDVHSNGARVQWKLRTICCTFLIWAIWQWVWPV